MFSEAYVGSVVMQGLTIALARFGPGWFWQWSALLGELVNIIPQQLHVCPVNMHEYKHLDHRQALC